MGSTTQLYGTNFQRVFAPIPIGLAGTRAGPGAITCQGQSGIISLTGCSTGAAAGDVTTVVTNSFVGPNSLIILTNRTGATVAPTSCPVISLYGNPTAGTFTIRIFNAGAVAFNNTTNGDLLIQYIIIN